MSVNWKNAQEKAARTARWAVTMAKVRIRRVVSRTRWQLVTFYGKSGGESVGVVDLLAIRKDHCQPVGGIRRGDALQIILIPRLFLLVCRSPSVANQFTTAAFIAGDFVLMKSSTKDKIKGGFEEAKGKVKEKAGKATGDPDLRDRGTAEKAGGKVRRKIGDLKKVFEQ
jgi:Uncharacterized protein conserved in bacteria